MTKVTYIVHSAKPKRGIFSQKGDSVIGDKTVKGPVRGDDKIETLKTLGDKNSDCPTVGNHEVTSVFQLSLLDTKLVLTHFVKLFSSQGVKNVIACPFHLANFHHECTTHPEKPLLRTFKLKVL